MSAWPKRLQHLPDRANTSICRCALSRQVSLSMRVEFSAGRSKIGSTLLSQVAECQWRKNCESGKRPERCPCGLNHKKNRRSLPAVDRLTPVRKERGQVPFSRAQDKRDDRRDRLARPYIEKSYKMAT